VPAGVDGERHHHHHHHHQQQQQQQEVIASSLTNRTASAGSGLRTHVNHAPITFLIGHRIVSLSVTTFCL